MKKFADRDESGFDYAAGAPGGLWSGRANLQLARCPRRRRPSAETRL